MLGQILIAEPGYTGVACSTAGAAVWPIAGGIITPPTQASAIAAGTMCCKMLALFDFLAAIFSSPQISCSNPESRVVL